MGSGAHEWNRTIDLLLTKEVLYRLSYVSDEVVVLVREINGAGDGNRTRASSLEGYSSTIELLPHRETTTTRNNNKNWWREVDSNHRRRKPADLQSAPVGRLGIPPGSPD